MIFRNQFLKYKLNLKEGDNEDEGGGGGGKDLQAQLDKALLDIDKIKANRDELLGEKKKEQERRREAEALAEEEKQSNLLKNKDFEQLYTSSQESNKAWEDKYNKREEKLNAGKIESAALKMAGDIADGVNIENLSTFIMPRLRYTEDGIKVMDSSGNLTVSSLDDLKAEFKGNARFASLIRGSQASGSGANGGKNGSGASKEMSRDEWDNLSHNDRSKFSANGGKVIN